MPYTEIHGIPVFGVPPENALHQRVRAGAHADRAAVMTARRLGHAGPVGGGVACGGLVSPSRVGYDSAGRNTAVLLDADADDIRGNISTSMDGCWKRLSFVGGRKNKE